MVVSKRAETYDEDDIVFWISSLRPDVGLAGDQKGDEASVEITGIEQALPDMKQMTRESRNSVLDTLMIFNSVAMTISAHV